MRNDIQLHIFTNATVSAPDTTLIQQTYGSFVAKFGADIETQVWCDRHPNVLAANQYLNNLRLCFDKVHETTGLSDGYTRAVRESKAEYLFMLEHDWLLLDTITHELIEIIQVMKEHRLLHLRFNKRRNAGRKCDVGLLEVEHKSMPYCTTNFLSNNPHIIDRQQYLDRAIQFITIREKSFGIEKNLTRGGFQGAIYGPINHPATVEHLDGKTFQIHTRS